MPAEYHVVVAGRSVPVSPATTASNALAARRWSRDIPRRHRRSADCARSERGVRRECDLGEGPRDGLEGPAERLRVRDGGALIRLGHLIPLCGPLSPHAPGALRCDEMMVVRG